MGITTRFHLESNWIMRTISLMLVLLAGTIAPARAQDAAKHWIFFTDKQPDATARLESDSATPAALARRATRGRQLDPMLDAPLAPAYLDALRDLGVAPLVESRWLNGVSAVLTDAERTRVEALPFVRALRPVGIVAPAAEQAPTPLAFAAPVPK